MVAKPEEILKRLAEIKKVVVLLIKPSHWDKEGYLWRFKKGVLPSNTLKVMYSLTAAALEKVIPDNVAETEVLMLEDGIEAHAKQLRMLSRRFPEANSKLIVCLVGVQTAQFPRACHLINQWQEKGATCVIGGAHVTGSLKTQYYGINDPKRPNIPCPQIVPKEIQTLIDQGTIIFFGEAEATPEQDVWAETLGDIVAEKTRPLYQGGINPIFDSPLPVHPTRYLDSYAGRIGTLDTTRGCVFGCNFCAVINIQGRKMRCRNPKAVVQHIKGVCEIEGQANFFFVDDNFARNIYWREILEGLADLRKQGYKVHFMIQADTQCLKIKDFFHLLREAGCNQIFTGMESVNPLNLKAAGKSQNDVDEYGLLASACHEHSIALHVGYMIGQPHDTLESVIQDVQTVKKIGVDQASFFVYTPIPGSEIHIRALTNGVAMETDLNMYDSFTPVWDHPTMTRDQVLDSYHQAWREFYKPKSMAESLKRLKSNDRKWTFLSVLLWYWWSYHAEQIHPMIAGFRRIRSFADRRPDGPKLPYGKHVLKEKLLRPFWYLGWSFAAFYVFQYLVLETFFAPKVSQRKEQAVNRVTGWVQILKNTWLVIRGKTTREWLNQFWICYGRQKWQLLNPLKWHWHLRLLPCALSEIVLTIRCAPYFFRILKGVT